jgi:hypothetical protein
LNTVVHCNIVSPYLRYDIIATAVGPTATATAAATPDADADADADATPETASNTKLGFLLVFIFYYLHIIYCGD